MRLLRSIVSRLASASCCLPFELYLKSNLHVNKNLWSRIHDSSNAMPLKKKLRRSDNDIRFIYKRSRLRASESVSILREIWYGGFYRVQVKQNSFLIYNFQFWCYCHANCMLQTVLISMELELLACKNVVVVSFSIDLVGNDREKWTFFGLLIVWTGLRIFMKLFK